MLKWASPQKRLTARKIPYVDVNSNISNPTGIISIGRGDVIENRKKEIKSHQIKTILN